MANTYIKIASVTVGAGGASSIDFNSIPQTYTDLVVKLSCRLSGSSQASSTIKFNGSTSGYSLRYLVGAGSAGTGSGTASAIWPDSPADSTYTANSFSNSEFYIPNYTSSNNKSTSSDIVNETNGTVVTQLLVAGLWSNTAAITSISVVPGAGSFVQYSSATLYGISKS